LNSFQEHWWRQARSDYAILAILRKNGVEACHQLHYLQMVTEKLAKAYFWGSGKPSAKSHAGFVQFMRILGQIPRSKRKQVADIFEFRRFKDFRQWTRSVLPLAYALERLAPALANDGPNTEYPWPQAAPAEAPATFDFDIWKDLAETGSGRHLLKIIGVAVDKFPEYG